MMWQDDRNTPELDVTRSTHHLCGGFSSEHKSNHTIDYSPSACCTLLWCIFNRISRYRVLGTQWSVMSFQSGWRCEKGKFISRVQNNIKSNKTTKRNIPTTTSCYVGVSDIMLQRSFSASALVLLQLTERKTTRDVGSIVTLIMSTSCEQFTLSHIVSL